jgi:TRAP-type C4-dicarboxylate transport system permease small subunit
MKKAWKIADTIMYAFAEHVGAAMTFCIFIIISFMVVIRYIFKTSYMGFEELPLYFLMIAIWLGAVVCSRDPKEGQIRIDLLNTVLRNRPKARMIVNICIQFFSLTCMIVYACLSWKYTAFNYHSKAASWALHIPIWTMLLMTSLAVTFLVVYESAILFRAINDLKGIVKEGKAA